MKFCFYFFYFIIHIFPCLGSEEDFFESDDDYYEHLIANLTKSKSQPIELPSYEQKLIKTSLEKFERQKFFSAHSSETKASILNDKQRLLVEQTVSTEIKNILLRIKLYLDKSSQPTQVFNPSYLVDDLKVSLENVISLTPLLYQPATSDQEEDSHELEKLDMTLKILLDRYFRNQLLAFGHAFLAPVLVSGHTTQEDSTCAIKLKFFHLIDEERQPDTLATWTRKKQILFQLDQVVRHITNPVTLSEIPEFLTKLNYTIDQKYLLDYYEESFIFLTRSYHQELSTLKTSSDLNKSSLRYLNEYLGFYTDFIKIFPELLREKELGNFILKFLKEKLVILYNSHMQMTNIYFKRSLKGCSDIDTLSRTLKEFILEAQKFNARFTINFEHLYGATSLEKYQETIIAYFDDTLDYLENQYEANRNEISRTLSSFGLRPSQTKEFLISIETLYKIPFPFLFKEITPQEPCFATKARKLIEKTEAEEQERVNKTLTTLSTVKSYLDISKWWQKDTSK